VRRAAKYRSLEYLWCSLRIRPSPNGAETVQDVAVPDSSSYAEVGASGGSLLPLSRGLKQVGTTPGVEMWRLERWRMRWAT